MRTRLRNLSSQIEQQQKIISPTSSRTHRANESLRTDGVRRLAKNSPVPGLTIGGDTAVDLSWTAAGYAPDDSVYPEDHQWTNCLKASERLHAAEVHKGL